MEVWNPDYVNEDGSKGAYMLYYCTSSTAIRSCIGYAISLSFTMEGSCTDTRFSSAIGSVSVPLSSRSEAPGVSSFSSC